MVDEEKRETMKKKKAKSKVIKQEKKELKPKQPVPAKPSENDMSSPVCYANSPEIRDEFK